MNATESAYDADLIILGGGCAGLSLAARLATDCNSLRVVVLEPRTVYFEDRTWCGWRTSPHPYMGCAAVTWPTWRVMSGGRTVQRGSSTQPYEMIPAHHFYEESLQTIRANALVQLRRGCRAEALLEDVGGVSTLLADGSTLRSRWVVDTRPQQATLAHPSLWQNFVGYEITADAHWTDLLGTTPILMDFQPRGTSAVQFLYVLPLGGQRFLCEWTRFSSTYGEIPAIEESLKLWLQQRGCTDEMIGRRESGSLPMSVVPAPASATSRIVCAGTRGGNMRASTGYAFHSIQRWADRCAQSLTADGPPLAPARSGLLDFLDEVFLAALQADSSRGDRIFLDLFEHTDPDRLIRFLSGIPKKADVLPVMASLPWLQFSRAALELMTRKVVRR
jgi:lycopene beta-cyclase